MWGNLIEIFIWIKGFNKGDTSKVLTVNEQARTRSSGFRLDEYRFKQEIDRKWFPNKVVDELNRHNSQVVIAITIKSLREG